jgi:hypothetical protein
MVDKSVLEAEPPLVEQTLDEQITEVCEDFNP